MAKCRVESKYNIGDLLYYRETPKLNKFQDVGIYKVERIILAQEKGKLVHFYGVSQQYLRRGNTVIVAHDRSRLYDCSGHWLHRLTKKMQLQIAALSL